MDIGVIGLNGRMTITHRAAALLTSICLLFTLPVFADTTIIIVRHGEKPVQGLGQLSCQGLNRALALPSVLLSRYGNPVAIYAPNPAIKKFDKGVPYAYVRPLATIEPLAIRVGLPVNIEWAMADVLSLSERLLAQTEGTHVVAWEHHYGEKLAKYSGPIRQDRKPSSLSWSVRPSRSCLALPHSC